MLGAGVEGQAGRQDHDDRGLPATVGAELHPMQQAWLDPMSRNVAAASRARS